MVTGAIGSLLPKLFELLRDEYGLQKGVKEKVESLSRELEVAQAALTKIGDVPWHQLDEQVRLWARDVREASYDMEDIVDTFLVRVHAPEHNEPHMLRHLRKKVGALFKKSKARRKISRLIQEIDDKLKEVEARHRRYSVESIPAKSVPSATIDPRLVNLYKTVTELVGIEGPRDDLINKLTIWAQDDDSEKRMKIVSIVGIGGLGKTTLAKAIYDQLKPRFECGAFVPVGQNPDVKKVFRDILIGLDEEKYTYSKLKGLDENQLMGKLNEFVKENRCFIVVDDIWDMEPWKLIRCAMRESHSASRVVITTRNFKVATHADKVHEMQPLSPENSRKLLYARTVDVEGNNFDTPTELCEKILRKCGGVPLAIITIASLLASKPSGDWSEIYKSIGFGHEGNSDVDNTRKILSFSYYDLPSHLKPCLLYLGIFPEDSVIEKNTLIWKWVAEGFIIVSEKRAAQGVGLFELGERYFCDLINRSMIQPHETKYEGYVDACSLHDMVLDMIHSISSNEDFFTVLKGNGQQKLAKSIARRLVLHGVELQNSCQLAKITVEKVRSLISTDCNPRALCPSTPVLRLLNMDYDDEIVCSLGSLLHLRYLRVHATYLTELPREVRYLKFLQTLDLWRISVKLPEEVGLLTQLVCLRADFGAGVIGKLTSLQELWTRAPDDPSAATQFVKDLGLLRELRVLQFRIDVDEERGGLLHESLGNLHNIREMEIRTAYVSQSFLLDTGRTSDVGIISYQHLRFMNVTTFRFSRLPAWIKSSHAPNLSYLEIKLLVVKEQDIRTLARLPELCCLKLYNLEGPKLITIKFDTEDVAGYFPKLRFLMIRGSTFIWFDVHSSECNDRRRRSSVGASTSTIMPSLESLEFLVRVRSLLDETQLGFDKLLRFDNLGRSSLQSVTVYVHCEGARASEVEEAESALVNAAALHPKNPTLQTKYWLQEHSMLSPYKEACMDKKRVNKAWNKLTSIVGSRHIRALCMPDLTASSSKVIRLLYTDEGDGLLALSSNAVHKLWKWEHSSHKSSRGKATTSVPPQLWQPENGIPMTNDTANADPEAEATACMALMPPNYGGYLFSASGGALSVFDISTFKVRVTFMRPPSAAATVVAFHPRYNSILAIGMDDSSIQIYDYSTEQVEMVLTGHQQKITGLAFSELMSVLVSSDSGAQLCVWSLADWEKKNSIYIQLPYHPSRDSVGDTTVQFHYDQTQILAVHGTQLVIYDSKLECLCSWSPRGALPALISSAIYSSDGLLVYAGFCDGAIGIFQAESLTLQCRIAPSAYIPSSMPGGGPMVVAVNPWKPNQMAVGMSDGAVYVIEPSLDADLEV